jgi:transposase, IS30 family
MNQGSDNAESCRMLGVGRRTGSKWRNGYRHTDPKTGRVYTYPAVTAVREQPAAVSAWYLSEDGRIAIADRHRSGEGARSIAAGLGRAPSTVSRELRRNRNPAGHYRPRYAHKKARIRRQPRKAFPARKDLHIVHETIYQALYLQGRGGLRRELAECLRTGRDRREAKRSIARRSPDSPVTC